MVPAKRNIKYRINVSIVFAIICLLNINSYKAFTQSDTTKLRYPVPKSDPYKVPESVNPGGLYLAPPSNLETVVEYDADNGFYIVKRKIGDTDYLPPVYLTPEQFKAHQYESSIRQYWREKRRSETYGGSTSLLPKLQVGGETFDRIFGGNTIDIIPLGQANLTFGVKSSFTENPNLDEKNQRTTTLDYQSDIQLNVTGKIGEKLKLNVQYNTEATFQFENNVKIEYSGDEDEIIQKIEVGNVSLPLEGSLITGSQSLFGFKTALKFGKLEVTSIFSQQRGETQVIEVSGGAQTRQFELKSDEYDANRHFFLSQYFRETYNQALENMPIINSGIQITKIEVWVTNRKQETENVRSLVAFMDLAENVNNIYNTNNVSQSGSNMFPDNSTNTLYSDLIANPDIRFIDRVASALSNNYTIGTDYEKLQSARMLNSNEYYYNKDLGFISLNTSLNNDEILAVAYEYNFRGKTYKVGELSTDGINAPENLILKLLKGTNFTPKIPTWKLMMKNVYDIGAYQLSQENFKLNVLYNDDQSGSKIPYIPAGSLNKIILLNLLNLDNTNSSLDQFPDGVFDFIEGITVLSSKGKIIFPVLEPFGSDLGNKFQENEEELRRKYTYQELYDSTLTIARQQAHKNKFIIQGQYQSSSGSDISLNAMNIPEGSVVVTAGGQKLVENVDYQVDYTLGRVKIINPGLLESETPIKISLESNSFFNMQTKTLLGSHLNYEISKDFNVGATILNLTEKPITQKVNIGDEPISNTIWGLNASYSTESQFLTTLIDKLPLIETKQPSRINITGEFAHLIPGHSKLIEKEGVAYIDDFESSETSMDISTRKNWKISSTPKSFGESTSNEHDYNYNRAKIAWYNIARSFYEHDQFTPDHIKQDPDAVSDHLVRQIFEKEIFPNKDIPSGVPSYMSVLNVAYYPTEKGPYNYLTEATGSFAGLDENENLLQPESRWAGITRQMTNPNFEASNYEYIEFWLMDPFVNNKEHKGGKIVFNLGNISEDVLKDSRRSFESGLPTSEELKDIDTTAWGIVPTIYVGNETWSVDASGEIRRRQDVGLDGLSDEQERSFHNSTENDPSHDNYHFYRGADFDDIKLGILDRYKNYNGLEGNSLIKETVEGDYETSYIDPDTEDLNKDYTLNETDSYYEYEVDLAPDNMEIGLNEYIKDKISYTATFANGDESEVNWYQFKIPIKDFKNKTGSIEDFTSIRFMRMYLTQFSEEVVLRFARLDLVRGEWRRLTQSFAEGSEGLTSPQAQSGLLEVSAVNIEENGKRYPVNYVLPPKITRIYDPMQPQLAQLNEQAMVLRLHDLADGDAKAVFKNIGMDIRQYKHIIMDVHAEKFLNDENLKDDDLTLFLRLGSDFKENYYEYEVPLSLTPHLPDEGSLYHADNDRDIVWPEDNRIDFDLLLLQRAKQARNDAMSANNSTINLNTVYTIKDGKNNIRVAGNPNLSNVNVILIGVRNPGQQNDPEYTDDGMAKSVEVWVNELRLSDFDEEGGWAANGRMTTNLADLGSVTLAGSTSTAGFGSLEQKVNERQKDDRHQYDISSTMELGKFFPESFGVKLPLYFGFSRSYINPKYNPLDPDIPLEAALKNAPSEEERTKIKHLAQDFTQRRSINLTNIQITPKSKEKAKKKHFYSISNFSTSFSYNETFFRNPNIEYNLLKNYRGAFSYNFMKKPKNFSPFKKVKFLRNKNFKLIKDFNFYLSPSQINFRTDLNRKYNEIKTRNLANPELNDIIPASFEQNFVWNRYYTLKYDLSKSLKLTFNATNVARIDEPIGQVNKEIDPNQYYHWRDSVMENLGRGGRNISYNHTFDLSYNIPINKLPLLDWTNATAKYQAGYNWDAAPILNDELNFNPGNTISNSNTMQLNGTLNLLKLYNKVGFLKKINREYRKTRRKKKPKKYKTVTHEATNINLRAGKNKSVNHNLKTMEVTVKAFSAEGKEIKGTVKVVSDNKIRFKTDTDNKKAKIVVTGKVIDRENPLKLVMNYSLRFLMGLENVSVSYSRKQGSVLPGFLPESKYMGLSQVNNQFAPGIPFVLGFDPYTFDQNSNRDFGYYAQQQNWLSTDTSLTAPFATNFNENLSLRASVKPINGLKIDLTANKLKVQNDNKYYIADASENITSDPLPFTNGNMSISIIAVKSAFENPTLENDFKSEAFNNFLSYRETISRRLGKQRTGLNNEDGSFADGYSELSQQVLIPAFLAAYTGQDANLVKINSKDQGFLEKLNIPIPNWKISYNGLTKIKFFKEYFKTFNISHQYRSTFSVGSFITNNNFTSFEDGFANDFGDYVDQYDYNSISIDEKFAPLINLDFTLHNSVNFRFETKMSRRIDLSLANNQITENKNEEYTVGIGYIFEELPFSFNNKTPEGKLNLRTDFSLRKDQTILRAIAEGSNNRNAGQSSLNYKFNADYAASQRLNIRMFVTFDSKIPYVTKSYPSKETYVGLSVRFNLSE